MRPVTGALAVATALLVLLPTAASAAVVADWEMNEPSGATEMQDASGHSATGTIGALVRTGVRTPTGRGYRFGGASKDRDPARVVTVADQPRLNPGTRPFSVTVRFKTRNKGPNLVQKGQSREQGGYWKVEVHKGWPSCFFRDTNGNTKAVGFVHGPAALQVNDHRWHTVLCERRARSVHITLEPGTRRAAHKRVRGSIGSIENVRPVVIGGKLDCASPTVGCDYLRGAIDWIRIRRP